MVERMGNHERVFISWSSMINLYFRIIEERMDEGCKIVAVKNGGGSCRGPGRADKAIAEAIEKRGQTEIGRKQN